MLWLVNGKTIAWKARNPTHEVQTPIEGSSIECSNCHCRIEIPSNPWPGLPTGVKFDPSDEELLKHLRAKVRKSNSHPFIDAFIPTLGVEDDIGKIHPEKLPGIKHDGSSYHYFHRPAGAYAAEKGKRCRSEEDEDKFGTWQKMGKERSVSEDGKELGFKKIMVFNDTNAAKKSWVMHQYYLGLQKESMEDEYVVSKIFYQKQKRQGKNIGVEDNFEKKSSMLKETKGLDSVLQQLKISKTMMNVSSPREGQNMVTLVEMQKNLPCQDFKTNMTGIDASSAGKLLAPPLAFGDPYFTLQHKEFENGETMMDVPWLGETFPPSVCSEMPSNSQFGTDKTRKGASHVPALMEMGSNVPHKGLFQQLMEDTKTMWDTSFPQAAAVVEEKQSVLKQNGIGIAHDAMHARSGESNSKMEIDDPSCRSIEKVELGTPPDNIIDTQEAQDLVEGVVNQLSLMTDSQKLSDSWPN